MASKKHTTNQPRFRVESIGSRLALVDYGTGDIRHCPAGTTRAQADRQCDSLNGAGEKAPRDPPSHERRFQKRGELITFEEIEDIESRSRRHSPCGSLDPDIYGHLRAQRLRAEEARRRELIAEAERRLPAALAAWGAKEPMCRGYAGPKRRDWSIDQILAWVDADDAIEEILAVHFLSQEPSHVKAGYFGIEKRAYLNKVKAAIQRLARRYVRRLIDDASDYTLDIFDEDHRERYEDEPRGSRRYPRVTPAAQPGRPANLTPSGASIRARMDELSAAFGRQSQRETLLGEEFENERSLAESGINPSDEI